MAEIHDHREYNKQLNKLYGPNRFRNFLDRLGTVIKRGDNYRAKCPAHDGKSSTSLSARETEDGRILVHCFGGCAALDVMAAVGLELSDLMPERLPHNATHQQRRKWAQDAQHRDWQQIMAEVVLELRVVLLTAAQLRDSKPLNDTDQQRLEQAITRIETCGRVIND